MILTNCAACAAPLAHTAPRCVRCHTRYCDDTCQHDHWRRGHKQICKKIHRGGNAEQYYADKKYKEAVAEAVEACADDTKGQTCYICTQALHWKTKEGLVRGCSCRGTAGFAHVSCLAEQAKILVAEAEENNLGAKAIEPRWARWSTCGLCEQDYHGVVSCALGWACWKTYVGRPEGDWARQCAMTLLGIGLADAQHHEDALSVKEADLAMRRRLGVSEHNILVAQNNLAITYQILGRHEEALRLKRDVYSGRLKLHGEEHESTLRAAYNYALSLRCLQRFKEAKLLLRRTIPVGRRVLGEGNRLTLKMRCTYAEVLYNDTNATLDDLREAVTTLEDSERIARRVLGGAHPVTKGIVAALQDARAALRARETPGETPRETTGSFQRASEEKLRTRRIVSVADRFRRSAAEAPPPSEPTTTAAVSASASSLAGTVSRFELAVPAATTIQRGIRKHLGKATTAAAPDSAPSLADAVSQFGKAVSDGKYRRA